MLRLRGEHAAGHATIAPPCRGVLIVIAVASGKGGTGKTTIATNLAFVAAGSSQPVQLVDCDVEEPNCHIFLNPTITETHTEELLRPQVNQAACTFCGACERTCRFHAIVCVKEQVLLFGHLCHGCGACAMVCPQKAIDEVPQPLGVVELGRAGAIHFVQGRLEVREARSAMLVRAVRRYQMPDGLVILDAPPGTACPVVAAMHGVDRAVLVTEPTPFGLNDLKMAVAMLRQMSVPFAVVINQCDVGAELKRRGKLGPAEILLPARSTTLLKIDGVAAGRRVVLEYTAANFRVEVGAGLPVRLEIPRAAKKAK